MSNRQGKKQRMAARKRERDAMLRMQRRNEAFEAQAETKSQRKVREDLQAEADRIAARRAEHNLVDGQAWIMADACVGRTNELCDKLKSAGIPHFRATDEVERVLLSGRRQMIKVPLVARTVFVGVEHRDHLATLVEKFPWLGEKAPQQDFGRDKNGKEFHWVVKRVRRRHMGDDKHGNPVYSPATIPEKEVKDFATTVIGQQPSKAPDDSIKAGEAVRVEDGPFATFPGTVVRVDDETGDLIVDVSIFGRLTPVSLHPKQVTRLDERRAA